LIATKSSEISFALPSGTIENLETIGGLNRNYCVLAEKKTMKKIKAAL
jgi:hypothetical protein